MMKSTIALLLFSSSLVAQVFDPVAVDVSMIGFLGFRPSVVQIFDTDHPGCEGCQAHASFYSQLWGASGWTDYPIGVWDQFNFDIVDDDEPAANVPYVITGVAGHIYVTGLGEVADGLCVPFDITTPPWECRTYAGCMTFVHVSLQFPGAGNYRMTVDDGYTIPVTTLDNTLGNDRTATVSLKHSSTTSVCDEEQSYRSKEIIIQGRPTQNDPWQNVARIFIESYCGDCNVKEGN